MNIDAVILNKNAHKINPAMYLKKNCSQMPDSQELYEIKNIFYFTPLD